MHLMFDFGTVIMCVFVFSWLITIFTLVVLRMAKRAVIRTCKRVFFAPLPKFRRTA